MRGGLLAAEPSKPAEKPNIIFILADDLGIGNVSCYGADKQDDAATAAQKRLQTVLDQLNPAGGKVGPDINSESEGPKKKKGGKKAASQNTENSNGPEE